MSGSPEERAVARVHKLAQPYVVPLVPILGPGRRTKYAPMGSGVLLALGEDRFVASAAHVLAKTKMGQLSWGLDSAVLPLTGHILAHGDGEGELDVGVCKLARPIAAAPHDSRGVRLLFDQNRSPRLVTRLAAQFPDSTHVQDEGLSEASDTAVWDFARDGGFVIVSKDADFHQRSFLPGPPPKVIWVRLGNCTTQDVADLLTSRVAEIRSFIDDVDAAFLALS